jgi:AcrR family transcriptional regulator
VRRPEEFDCEEALRRAIPVFWENGFAGTSTDDLVRAMGIGRQSLYDTFGDKRGLFLAALRVYNTDSLTTVFRKLREGPTAVAALERILIDRAEVPSRQRSRGLMGVNSICELAGEDAEVAALNQTNAALLEAMLKDVIDDGQAQGNIRRGIDSRAAARFVAAARRADNRFHLSRTLQRAKGRLCRTCSDSSRPADREPGSSAREAAARPFRQTLGNRLAKCTYNQYIYFD